MKKFTIVILEIFNYFMTHILFYITLIVMGAFIVATWLAVINNTLPNDRFFLGALWSLAVYAVIMAILCILYFIFIERQAENIRMYFVNSKKKTLSKAENSLFITTFRISLRNLHIGEHIKGFDEIFCVDELFCEQLFDENLYYIITKLLEDSSEEGLNEIKKEFAEERGRKAILTYNNGIAKRLKAFSSEMNYWTFKFALLIIMGSEIFRNYFCPDIIYTGLIGFIESNIFNISAVLLLGIELIEGFKKKLNGLNLP